MSRDDEGISLEACTPPGAVRVTSPALNLAERFQASIPLGWIVAFIWYDGQRTRASKNSPWVDVGPGMGLGTYRIGDIPEEAVHHAGSFRYAVLIPKKVVDDHPQKLIDLDGPRSVILR